MKNKIRKNYKSKFYINVSSNLFNNKNWKGQENFQKNKKLVIQNSKLKKQNNTKKINLSKL